MLLQILQVRRCTTNITNIITIARVTKKMCSITTPPPPTSDMVHVVHTAPQQSLPYHPYDSFLRTNSIYTKINTHQRCYFSSGNDNSSNNSNSNSNSSSNNSNSNNSNSSNNSNNNSSNSNSSTQQNKPRRNVSVNDPQMSILPPSQQFATPEDPFGLLFSDGNDQLGPILPPIYERDTITGRLIAEDSSISSSSSSNSGNSSSSDMKQQQQLTDHDKRILSMDSMERDMKILESIQKHWQQGSSSSNDDDDDSHTTTTTTNTTNTTTTTDALTEIGERIRTTDMATNVLGRSVHGQRTKEILDDGTEQPSRETEFNFSQPLTTEEYNAFEQYMKTRHDQNISVDDIPVSTLQKPNPVENTTAEQQQQQQQQRQGRTASIQKDETLTTPVNPDEEELSLRWLTSLAQRQMDDTLDDNPYSDLMPGDLSPKRVVNRKQAKIIPTKLLHYNHMSLLQHYIGPSGQIMNRSQTRLGARDQRRISKLIKRSRALGLIPYMGQFKIENHGWIHTQDIHTNRKWEHQMEQRGLVIQPLSPQQQQQHQAKLWSSATTTSGGSSKSTKATTLSTAAAAAATTSSSSPSSTMALGALPDDF